MWHLKVNKFHYFSSGVSPAKKLGSAWLADQPKGGGVTDNKLSIPYIDASSIIEMIIRAHEPRYISIFAAAAAPTWYTDRAPCMWGIHKTCLLLWLGILDVRISWSQIIEMIIRAHEPRYIFPYLPPPPRRPDILTAHLACGVSIKHVCYYD